MHVFCLDSKLIFLTFVFSSSIRNGERVCSYSEHCEEIPRWHWQRAASETSTKSQEQEELGLQLNFGNTCALLLYRHDLLSWLFFLNALQLEEWWLDAAYLEVRIPSQLNVNFGGPAPYLEHHWPPEDGTCLQRASISTWYSLQYWNLLHT